MLRKFERRTFSKQRAPARGDLIDLKWFAATGEELTERKPVAGLRRRLAFGEREVESRSGPYFHGLAREIVTNPQGSRR